MIRRLLGRGGDDQSAVAGSGSAATTETATPGTSTQRAADATAVAETRRVDLRELRTLVRDGEELRKGSEVFDRGGLAHLARHGERIFAEAAGSGASPYRVTITLASNGETKARCSCMAARSRPICKHAAALLVAWARAPESFSISEAPPVPEGGATRRAATRTGRVKTEDLIGRGVEQVIALVRDLTVAGVASTAADRPDQIRALAETLRANRLRRLSARTLELAAMLEASLRRRGSLAPVAYADVVADLLLAARRIERHLGGEVLEDRQMEELVGRNWRKADRRAVEGLELVEYAYLVRRTADDYVIRERRFLDLASGTHYSEKQILPAFMARRTAPIASSAGLRLAGTGGVYPGYPPLRLDVDGTAPTGPLTDSELRRIVTAAVADPTTALAAFADHRRDVFAPDGLPVAVRVDAVVAFGDRLAVVGTGGDAIVLARGSDLVEQLDGVALVAVLGDIDLDGIMAELRPMAVVVVDDGERHSLRSIEQPAVASGRSADPETETDWLASARASGASAAALSLAEVRDELASVLVNGLGSLTERIAEPLATRLEDLGLERPASLLREVVARPDPVDRLDDVIRLHQVLGVGAVRLAGARQVERTTLIPVPGRPAVHIAEPPVTLPIEEVVRQRAAGTMTADEAAVHRARALDALPADDLAEILPWWADAAATDHVVRASAASTAPWTEHIDRALTLDLGVTAALTAVRLLDGWPDERFATDRLRAAAERRDPRRLPWASEGVMPERALRVAAAAALWARADRAAGSAGRQRTVADPAVVRDLRDQLSGATSRDRRVEAAGQLAALEDQQVLPALRRAWRTDPAATVRRAAARGVTSLGDTTMVDAFIDALVRRDVADDDAKAAAYALGGLGDVRGVEALLDALASGWKSSVVIEALAASGLVAVDAITRRALTRPEVAKRRSFVSALEHRRPADVSRALCAALDTVGSGPEAAEQTLALLRLAASHQEVHAEVAARIRAMPLGDSRAERALVKAASAKP